MPSELPRKLGLLDGALLLVGAVIGSGIFVVPSFFRSGRRFALHRRVRAPHHALHVRQLDPVKDVILSTGPLPVEQVLEIGIKTSLALEAAHRLGIVHRDIKSSNIMITAEAEVKVLDFGLAKAISSTPLELSHERTRERVEYEDVARETELTRRGTAVGTVPYMSPEQASGRALDPRGDLFSLGVVLYEAISGELPFHGRSDRELVAAIRTEDPTPLAVRRPEIPPVVSQAIARCLAKAPAERYPSAALLRRDLERIREKILSRRGALAHRLAKALGRRSALLALVGLALLLAWPATRFFYRQRSLPAPPAQIRLIGVLPFENVSGNPEENYLANAVPLELTASLGQIGALKVIPWSFMKRFREAPAPLSEMAKLTGADAVLDGSVQLVPPMAEEGKTRARRVRIQAQLFEARTGLLLWSQSFERGLGDFMAVSGEMARAIATQIQVKLARREQIRLASSRQAQPEAVELYLRGREFLEERSITMPRTRIASTCSSPAPARGPSPGACRDSRGIGPPAVWFS